MLFSYNWLKRFFPATDFPTPVAIVDALNLYSFEVEDVKDLSNDTIIDVDILPNRAHDCLAHKGLAKELAVIFDLNIIEKDYSISKSLVNKDLQVRVEDKNNCRAYLALEIDNIEVKESPSWLKDLLLNIETRPINNIVDIMNFVMFDIGQPLHVFDADLVEGALVIRPAKKGDKMITLDGEELILNENNLIIADNQGPLALAGIKGGSRAGVSENTKRIIIEAANFAPVGIRRSANSFNLRTDAAKRFENDLPLILSEEGIFKAFSLLKELLPEIKVRDYVEVYNRQFEPKKILLSLDSPSKVLGTPITEDDIRDILRRLKFDFSITADKLSIIPPPERLDLLLAEDIIEEIGRLHGYNKIKGVLPEIDNIVPSIDKVFSLSKKIKEIIVLLGYTELYSYTLSNRGQEELANPLTEDKKFLRTDLSTALKEKLLLNLNHTNFDQQAVRLFEIGNVFIAGEERTKLAYGIAWSKKKYAQIEEESELLIEKLMTGLSLQSFPEQIIIKEDNLFITQIDLQDLIDLSGDFKLADLSSLVKKEIKYKPFSVYPRIIRDIALFVDEKTKIEEVVEVIISQAGDFLVEKPILFDEFIKDNKKSLAFRLIFQSFDRTLSNEEINDQMDLVYKALEEKKWEIR